MLTSPEQNLLGREETLELAEQTKEAGTLVCLGHQRMGLQSLRYLEAMAAHRQLFIDLQRLEVENRQEI